MRAIALQCFCSADVDFNGGTILNTALCHRDFTSNIVYTTPNLLKVNGLIILSHNTVCHTQSVLCYQPRLDILDCSSYSLSRKYLDLHDSSHFCSLLHKTASLVDLEHTLHKGYNAMHPLEYIHSYTIMIISSLT